MTQNEFFTEITEVFKTHILMSERNYHTVNELLYVLEHDSKFEKEDFNISISLADGGWKCIPSLDAFIDVKTRGVWFNDADIEFEVEECDGKNFNCITIYERGEE